MKDIEDTKIEPLKYQLKEWQKVANNHLPPTDCDRCDAEAIGEMLSVLKFGNNEFEKQLDIATELARIANKITDAVGKRLEEAKEELSELNSQLEASGNLHDSAEYSLGVTSMKLGVCQSALEDIMAGRGGDPKEVAQETLESILYVKDSKC